MRYVDSWKKGREETRIRKEDSLMVLWEDMMVSEKLSSEEKEKMKNLIVLYLEAHDFVTKVGVELSTIVDKVKS
jgi:Mlc titration factor MtfA (ptsG expression regulator)